ncbi:FAD-dependent oxidoreductase [Pseudarthrobacter sp. TAF60_1]|uniref:FAD-dependent oxidoreductase n=1 Tax=Pseudarthrobacter sp. TAF60_1 TaxID=3233071 RepID=UPI003F9E4E47
MTDVVIVGGGPVGLYLAALLLQEGVKVRVLEQRLRREQHSRAIGIHPPALSALAKVGVASSMVRAGVPILGGTALSRGRTVGSMSFATVSGRFPFVLSLPQFTTESLLERRVHDLDASALTRGARVSGVTDDGGLVTVAVAAPEEAGGGSITGRLLVAADGARSSVRSMLNVPVNTKTYPDHYVMGDFAADGNHEQQAVLYLEAEGIVESFPLPGGLRRWVVRTERPALNMDAGALSRLVQDRTGVRPDPATNTMVSAFSPRSSVACRLVEGRAVLVGDAAHEISPIGGQGMNLGWLDAAELATIICAALAGRPVGSDLHDYVSRRRKTARRARWQAGVNMSLGRPVALPLMGLRNLAFGTVAGFPSANRLMARRFTMQ